MLCALVANGRHGLYAEGEGSYYVRWRWSPARDGPLAGSVATTLVNLFLIVFLVLLNGFFVAVEFSMVKVRSSRIAELVDAGHGRAKVAANMLEHMSAYLSACQLGITLASLGLGWVGEPTVAKWLEVPLTAIGLGNWVETIAFVVAFLVITFLHIVVGELTPKSLAIKRPERTVLSAAAPLAVFYRITYPVIWFLNGTADGLLKLMGIRLVEEGAEAHTEEELRILMAQSHQRGLIDNTEMALFDNIFDFSDRVAREVMVPRVDMSVVPVDASFDDLVAVLAENQHTRYPVITEDKDHIIGYVHVKDLWMHKMNEQFRLESIMRDIIRVPETAEISEVLKRMQKYKTQIAIVVDEFGGTAGLVTGEDILEELVGEIQDEFDDDKPPIMKTTNGYSVDARILVEEVSELLHTQLIERDVDTLGGWMSTLIETLPVVGTCIQENGYVFTVESVQDGRIERITIREASP